MGVAVAITMKCSQYLGKECIHGSVSCALATECFSIDRQHEDLTDAKAVWERVLG